jgi:hypothetical protein
MRGPRPTLKGEEFRREEFEHCRIGSRQNDVSADRLVPPANWQQSVGCTILVLRSNETFTMSKYRRDGDLLEFEEFDGTEGGSTWISWIGGRLREGIASFRPTKAIRRQFLVLRIPAGPPSLTTIDCRSSRPYKDVILTIDCDVVSDCSDGVTALD